MDAPRRPARSGRLPSTSDLDRELRRRLLGLTDDDLRLLNDIQPLFAAHAEEIVNAFYEQTTNFEETKNLLADPETVERLKRAQANYLLGLTDGVIDADYVADRLRIGRTHERIGLEPRWYIGTYGYYVGLLFPLIATSLAATPERLVPTLVALGRLMHFDMQLAIEAYIESFSYQLMRANSQLRRLNRELDQRVQEQTSALRASESHYRDLVENSPEMIHQVDRERRFVGVNATELRKLGYSIEEMRRMRLEDIVPSEQAELMVQHVEKVIQEGRHSCEARFVTRDGEIIDVEMSATALVDAQGEFLMTRAFVRDITERNRLNQQLMHMERLTVIGKLTASFAHEIGTPLNIISGRAEYISQDLDNKDQVRKGLRIIIDQIDRITEIITRMLNFSRSEPRVFSQISINATVEQTLQFLAHQFRKSNISLETEFDPDLPPLRGDGNQLQQVFVNLLVNAMQAMPGGGRIRVTTDQPNSAEVTVTCEDSGEGIKPEDLPRIFEPFYTTKGLGKGSGLGLSVSQQIIANHRGRITVESALGKGSLFTVHLPVAAREPSADDA